MAAAMNSLNVESSFRVGTIVYDIRSKKHMFFQGFFGSGTQIDAADMQMITTKLKELDATLKK